VVLLIISFPLWDKKQATRDAGHKEISQSNLSLLKTIPGLKQALLLFFCYCTIEASFGLWGASFLVFERGFETGQAAMLVSLYYLGITLGRFLSGFLTNYFTNRQLVYLGQGIIGLGLISLLISYDVMLLPGFLLVGLGCAPIFPSLLHETPTNFGERFSQKIMGMQMASAYVGIMLMPFLFGKIAIITGYSFLLAFLGIFLLAMSFLTRVLNQKTSNRISP
jgi:fucose permease